MVLAMKQFLVHLSSMVLIYICMSPSWSGVAIFYRRFSLANTVGNLHAKRIVCYRMSNRKKTTTCIAIVGTVPLYYHSKVIMASNVQVIRKC